MLPQPAFKYWIPWLINNVLFFGYGFITGQWQRFAKYGSVHLGLAPPNSLVHAIIILLVMTILPITAIDQSGSSASRSQPQQLVDLITYLPSRREPSPFYFELNAFQNKYPLRN